MKILLIALLLFGCGNHTKVTVHETTREDILQKSNGASAWGCAIWEDRNYEVLCDIYILPEDEYYEFSNKAEAYDRFLKHELRHCYEFNYHP